MRPGILPGDLTFAARLSTFLFVQPEIDCHATGGGDDPIADYVWRAQAGAPEGYKQLFRLHVRRLHRLVYRLAGPHRRPLHGRRGLLLGQLRRLSRTLLARTVVDDLIHAPAVPAIELPAQRHCRTDDSVPKIRPAQTQCTSIRISTRGKAHDELATD